MTGKLPAVLGRIVLPFLSLSLGACNLELMNPKGAVGAQEKDLILIALGLMLLVVIPVIVLTLVFAWRYREKNTKANYAPKWSHSTAIEVVVWSIPVVIVATLGVLIWKTTHSLDPYRPLESEVEPVKVEVVSLDWKWLFIYPDYGVATVNQLPVPVGTPINFRLTSGSNMNSFFIPQLGSQIYTMAGMQTKLHLIADEAGTYAGRSASFSGPGFSDMHFKAVAMPRERFDAWIKQAKTVPAVLDKATYQTLARPSAKAPVATYSHVTPGLFDSIVHSAMTGSMPDMTHMPEMAHHGAGDMPEMARHDAGHMPAGPVSQRNN